MQTCVALCVGQVCYVYRTMCKTHNVYLVLSTPCRLWHCVSHSFLMYKLNKIYITHMSLIRTIVVPILKCGFTKSLDFLSHHNSCLHLVGKA